MSGTYGIFMVFSGTYGILLVPIKPRFYGFTEDLRSCNNVKLDCTTVKIINILSASDLILISSTVCDSIEEFKTEV